MRTIERAAKTMRALVYGGPGKREWKAVPKPEVGADTDAVVRVTTATICGTDLHILKGDVPDVAAGRVLGHEGVGVVESVGSGVRTLRPGDKVLVSCISSCGACGACRRRMYSHCERGGGWVLGHLIDGTQAEYVRVPFADTSLHKVPAGTDEDALAMLSDIFPTGYECGVLNGGVKPGDTVAIVGAGPIGLATLLTARFFTPAEVILVDRDPNRLAVGKAWGATRAVCSAGIDAVSAVMAITEGRGVDVAVEAVGVPETFDVCQRVVSAGGRIANIGVHGKPVRLNLERLWSHNIVLTTRLVDTETTPMLLKLLLAGKLDAGRMVTHRFPMRDAMRAYDVFAAAAGEKALKVTLKGDA